MTNREPLLPADWSELSPLVDRLLDAPSSERPALLGELAGDNPARRAELERLVAECERELLLLERPAVERFPQLREENAGPQLPEVLGGLYRIEREIGRGGMARVYLAHDLRHSRPVAVKVIRHEIASSLGRDRFLREIGIAARLRHPNIMPLYDSGDVDGLLYFVMPYEEGKSLRARLDVSTKLVVGEAVSILRDIARALAYAHDQGVVHRDVKPDNVLLSGDAAVVTDFGIAKALTVATRSETVTGTQAGTVIGTPAYMSPEQALGDPATDHRADIYAFGCLAYELFAGAPPFTGATTHEIILNKLCEPLKPLTDHRPDTPETVARLIARCLEKDPAARPASAAELLDVLGAMPAAQKPAVVGRRWSRRLVAAAIGLSVMILGGWYAARASRGAAVTIAVLPLQVTGDSQQALAQGFTDDLAAALVRVPWLRVMSRGGASNYRGLGNIEYTAVGDSLHVRYLLMGSFRQENGGVSVTLQLVSVEDGSVAWADKFTQPANLAALRDQIVAAVGETLRGRAGRFAKSLAIKAPARRQVTSEAARLYLLGKKQLSERGEDIAPNIKLFREAIDHDSTLAEAWSGMSLALAFSPAFREVVIDSVSAEARRSAERALQLDPSLSEPHIAMGVIHGLYWRWSQAEDEFKKAIALNPQDVEARIQYARLLLELDRGTEARQRIEEARADDPVSSLVLSFKAYALLQRGDRGDLDSAKVWSNRAMQSNPNTRLSRIFRAMLLVKMKKGAEARELVQTTAPFEPYTLYVIGASGDSATVRNRLRELAASGPRPTSGETARAYALLGLGDTTGGLDALERATDRHEIWPTISPPTLPVFDAVRHSPRFRALLKRVGLAAQ